MAFSARGVVFASFSRPFLFHIPIIPPTIQLFHLFLLFVLYFLALHISFLEELVTGPSRSILFWRVFVFQYPCPFLFAHYYISKTIPSPFFSNVYIQIILDPSLLCWLSFFTFPRVCNKYMKAVYLMDVIEDGRHEQTRRFQ